MLLARIISFFAPLVIGFITSAIFWQQRLNFWQVVIVDIIWCGLTIWWLLKKSAELKKIWQYLAFIGLPVLFSASSFLVLVLLEDYWFKLIVLVMVTLFSLVYYNAIFKSLYKKSLWQTDWSANPFNYLECLTVFFTTTGLFGLKDFLHWRTYMLMMAVFILIIVLAWISDVLAERLSRSRLIFYLIWGIMMAEIFWAIISLPIAYYIEGLVFTAIFTSFSIFLNPSFSSNLTARAKRNYLILLFIIAAILMATAKWY